MTGHGSMQRSWPVAGSAAGWSNASWPTRTEAMNGFLHPVLLRDGGPAQFVRQIERLLWHQGFAGVTNIDGSGDGGGDIVGRYRGRDWVVQCKWKARGAVTAAAVDETA